MIARYLIEYKYSSDYISRKLLDYICHVAVYIERKMDLIDTVSHSQSTLVKDLKETTVLLKF